MNDDELAAALDDLLTALPPDQGLPPGTARRVRRRRRLKLGASALAGAGALVLVVVVAAGAGGPSRERLVPARPVPSSTTPTAGSSPTVVPTPFATGAPPAGSGASPSRTPSNRPAPTGTTTPPGPPSAGALRVVLRPDGLGVSDGGSATSFLAFGSDAPTAQQAVARALGTGQESATADCGSGTSTVQYDGLSLLLQGGRLRGWVTGTPGLVTGDGLGVGTTLAALREALPAVQVTEDTLGPEWSTVEGGLAGFLDGTRDSSRVTSIAAGARCLAR